MHKVWSDWDISLYSHGCFFKEIPNLMISLLYLSYLGSNIRIISVGLYWPPPIWMVQLASRLIFWGDSEYLGPMTQFGLWHLLYPKWYMGMRRGSGKVLWLGWFNLCLDSFFEENPNLKRKIWNSHCGSSYSHIWDGCRERVGWPFPIWMVQFSPRLIFWGESEYQDGIFITGL